MNLVTEPWVPILRLDGKPDLASLQQIFTEGNQYADLAVHPHERIALMRLLICIAQVALDGPENIDAWDTAPEKLPEAAATYLNKKQEVFELFHPQKPFLQISGLEPLSEATPVTKLDFTLATGNVSTLYDHEANQTGLRTSPPEKLALMLITYLNFSPGGLISQVKWNSTQTTKSSDDGICISKSMYHAYVRRGNLINTVASNLLTKKTVKNFYKDRWGCPVWDLMPKSFMDKLSIANATETYLGRLVPLSRLICLNKDRRTMALGSTTYEIKEGGKKLRMGIKFLGYPDIQREPSATAIQVKDERRLLGAGNKEIWRELPSILVKQRESDIGGALTLFNVPEGAAFDLYVGALMRKQANIVDTVESVLMISKGVRTDAGVAAYEKEVKYTDEVIGRRLHSAVATYFKCLKDDWNEKLRQETDPKKRAALRKKLNDKATSHFWTSVEKLRHLLIIHVDTIGQDADKVKESQNVWRKAVHKAARDAYRITCGQDTPRQMRAFALGWDRLFVNQPDDNTSDNPELETMVEI